MPLANLMMIWDRYGLVDEIYLVGAAGEPSLETQAEVLPLDPHRERTFDGRIYLLGIEQVRDAVTGLEAQLGRPTTAPERLRAVVHYARYDAFIDPGKATTG